MFCRLFHKPLAILAPKLTSRACALRVCSPPAAIAVTQAISQTLICKAVYELIAPHTLKWINSVIKLGHFVWNIIYCLSRIKFKDRWVVFFIYDSFCWPNRPRPLAWDQEMTPCKQMETMIIPTTLRSKTLLFSHKMKDAPLKYMIRI